MKPFTNKHSIAAGSPLHLGGSGESPLYQDKKDGNLPQQVDEYPNSRLVRSGSVVRERETGKVVIGGGYDDAKRFVSKPASQIEGERQVKAEIKKAKIKKRKEAEFNKPENVAKREANKAKLEAARAAREARDAKSATISAAKREANKAKQDAARDKRRG